MKPSNTILPTQQSARGSIRPLERHQPRIKPSTNQINNQRGSIQSWIKKIATSAFALLIAFHSFAWTGPDIQKLLQQSFEQSFPNAEHVTWSNDDGGGYTVTFTVKSILTRISYDKKGKFTASLRNYNEQMLPFFITNLLKQRYSNYQIFGVTEVTSSTDINYFVKLESSKNWITVRVDNDGNSMVVEKYRKQK